MSRFKSQFKRGGARQLVRQHGVSIGYYPRGEYGRQVTAIVNRQRVVGPSGSTSQLITCSVVDDADVGIASTEINDAYDKVMIALREGGTPELREITLMEDDSNGMVRFRVR